MTNALTEAQSRALAGLNPGLLAGLRRTVENAPTRGEGAYLSFGKDGMWSFGAENNEIADDDRFVIDIESLATGYVCWTDYSKEELLRKKKNEKLGTKMLLISQGEVDYSTLPDHGWDWRKQVGFRGRFLNDPYAGKVAVFESSSGGGDDAFSAVTAAIMQKLQSDVASGIAAEDLALYPVIRFANTFYMHKTYGKTYKPVFDIVGWANKDGRMADLQLEAPGEATSGAEEKVATEAATVPVGGPVQRRRRG
jgi:hypothetical protein